MANFLGYVVILFAAWLFISLFTEDAAIAAIVVCIISIIVTTATSISKAKNKPRTYKDDSNGSHYNPTRKNGVSISYHWSTSKKDIPATTQGKYLSSSSMKQYEVHHRDRDGFCDNMNYKRYKCKAIYSKTNRKRTVTIDAFGIEDVNNQLTQQGFLEPFEIERIDFPVVTAAQRDVLGGMSYIDVCQYDASALIDKKIKHDTVPNPELLDYATSQKIKLSYYIGKKALYDLLFMKLELREKIAFFIFCIYRYTTDDRQGNLSKCSHRDLFYKFADENISNAQFIKSMNTYNGTELRFFGTMTVDGVGLTGGSKRTIAYKTATEFLKNYFTLRH